MKLAIHGAAGRMGQRVIALASQDPEVQIVAALESATNPRLGQDAGLVAGIGEIDVPLAVVGESDADVVIDFSVPDAAVAVVAHCLEYDKPLVMATTGFEPDQRRYIDDAAQKIPLVYAPSFSPAVNLVMKLTEIAAGVLKQLPTGVDVEIIERHHRYKEDAPSGTALHFGQIVAGDAVHRSDADRYARGWQVRCGGKAGIHHQPGTQAEPRGGNQHLPAIAAKAGEAGVAHGCGSVGAPVRYLGRARGEDRHRAVDLGRARAGRIYKVAG